MVSKCIPVLQVPPIALVHLFFGLLGRTRLVLWRGGAFFLIDPGLIFVNTDLDFLVIDVTVPVATVSTTDLTVSAAPFTMVSFVFETVFTTAAPKLKMPPRKFQNPPPLLDPRLLYVSYAMCLILFKLSVKPCTLFLRVSKGPE